MKHQFCVSTDGNDMWSGSLPQPNADKTDGPFATLARARDAARGVSDANDEGVVVNVSGGVYELEAPFELRPEDSGQPAETDSWKRQTGPERPIVYRGVSGETAVLSGGTEIKGWQETELNGDAVWAVELPGVKSGDWNFTQLWVNGRHAPRPRFPREGRFTIEEPLGEVVYEGDVHARLFTGQDSFRFRHGDLDAWRNVTDIEFVALHYWIESRIAFTSIDPETRVATLARKSRMRLTDDFNSDGAPYYVENVFEAFTEPGTWYLDRPSGTLYYRPLDGETLETATVVAPRLSQVLTISGTEADPVHHIRFENIQFSHTEWDVQAGITTSTPQAACHLGGAVFLEGGEQIVFDGCEVSHVGSYGIEITGRSRDVDVTRCRVVDLGGGGVKVWHSFGSGGPRPGSGADRNYTGSCKRIRITDCEIGHGGYRAHQAVGVLVGMCTGVQILHNEIHNFDYSGVSVGWTWGYQESEAYGNLVEYNHIHDIGRRMLSDMGGIYTLGVQPGTRLTHNLIHDVWSRGYGGWGIYNDEGSSFILVESNVVFRTKSNGYNQHYGEENMIRNNIFALGGEAQFSRSRIEEHTSFHFTRNIVFFDSETDVLAGDWERVNAIVDRNLYFNRSGKPLTFAGATLEEWQARGSDVNSVVADPRFADPDNGDFTIGDMSTAEQIGFLPIDLSTVGPRPRPIVSQ